MQGPGTIYDVLALSGSADNDLWAITYNADLRLLEHWDGNRWTSFDYPQRGHASVLHGLTAEYPTFTWAVGETETGTDDRSLLLRWTGAKWVNERGK